MADPKYMDSKIKKLSIGIPTYNNPEGLNTELECILSQFKNNPRLTEVVEILVSDNSDNDKTQLAVSNFLEKIPNLIYIKNKTNIGFDRNIDQILTRANGLFCWTLSDNDPILDGGIKKIVEFIDSNPDIAHILINTNESKNEVKIFENMESMLIENNYEIIGGLISRNIFNIKYLPVDRDRYYDNYWFHLSVALEVGSKNKVALIQNLLEIKQAGEECRWAKNGQTFTTYTNLHSIVMNLSNFGYSKDFLNIYHRNFIKGLPHQVATGKLYGLKFNKKSLRTLYKHSRRESGTFLLCLCILITPVFILNAAKNIWKKL